MNKYETLAKDTIKAGKAVDAIKPGDVLLYSSPLLWSDGHRLCIYINISRYKYYVVSDRLSEISDDRQFMPTYKWLTQKIVTGHLKVLSV